MNKIWNLAMMLLLTTGFAACSDSNDENGGGTTPEQKHGLTEEQMMQREAVASVLNMLTGENFCDTTDVDFEGRTYEATIGVVRNESRPSERSIKVRTATLAEGFFRSLVGGASELITETADGCKIDLTNLDCHSTGRKQSLGTLTFHRAEGGDNIGYADIDIPCIPSLQRISYKTQDQWGDNGTWESPIGYGEVFVGKGRYWICVRESEGKNPDLAGVLINMQSGKGDWTPLYDNERWAAWKPANDVLPAKFSNAILQYIELCGDSHFAEKKSKIMKQSYGVNVFPSAWGWNWSAKNKQWELWDYNDPGFGTLDEGYCHRAYYSPGMCGMVIVMECNEGSWRTRKATHWRRWRIWSTGTREGKGWYIMADHIYDFWDTSDLHRCDFVYTDVDDFYQFPYFACIYTVRAITFTTQKPEALGLTKVNI